MHVTLGFGCLGVMVGSFACRFRQDAVHQERIKQKQCHLKVGDIENYSLKDQMDKAIAPSFGKPKYCNIVICKNILYKNEVYSGVADDCGGTRRMSN